MKKLYDLFDEFIVLMKPSFSWFINENLGRVPDEEKSIKKFYLNSMLLIEYDPRDKKNGRVE